MNKEDFFNILASLFEMHTGRSNIDEDAWLEDFEAGKDPVAAFYDEFPEYEGLED